MELYTEQGLSRQECISKIKEKYDLPFEILLERQLRTGGFLGFFTKPAVEVGFCFKKPYDAGFEAEKRKVLAAAGKSYQAASIAKNKDEQKEAEQSQKVIIDMIKEIKDQISLQGKAEENPANIISLHPSFAKAAQLLKDNDFSEKYICAMLERMRKVMTVEILDNFDSVQNSLLEWIGESIAVYNDEIKNGKTKIAALIGPTGVGKTTTIAKLAAVYGITVDDSYALAVRMISIDAFRIGAQKQLESIGEIMTVPVSSVDNKHDLRKEIALHSDDIDLFLIDTIGNSPKDPSKIAEMKEILEGAGRGVQYHLVISAATKTADIEEIMRQFDMFNYSSVIVSKIDETGKIGNVISAIAGKGKPVSYITHGQDMIGDIKTASVVNLLTYLEGFSIDKEALLKRFPSGDTDHFGFNSKWKNFF